MKMEPTGSKFNSGIAQLERIDILRRKAHMAREKNKWDKFYKALQSIRAEVWEWLIPEERAKVKKYEADLDVGFNNLRNTGIDLPKVKEFEDYLNDLLHKYGLSMPSKDDFMSPENY